MKWKLNESKYMGETAQTSDILEALKMEDEIVKIPRKDGKSTRSLNESIRRLNESTFAVYDSDGTTVTTTSDEQMAQMKAYEIGGSYRLISYESMQLSGTKKLNGRRNLRRGKENPDNIKTQGGKTQLTGDYDLRESQRYQRETGKKYPVKKGMNQMDVVRDNRDLGGFGYKGDYEYDHPKGLNFTDGSDPLKHYAKERERFTNAKKNARFAAQAANIKASDDAPSYIKNDPRDFEADEMKFIKQARNILNNRKAHKPYEVNKTEYNESLTEQFDEIDEYEITFPGDNTSYLINASSDEDAVRIANNKGADSLVRFTYPLTSDGDIEYDNCISEVSLLSESLLKESAGEVEGLNAFITNLGKYNEGELVGEWAHFPMDEDDFKQLLQKIGIDGREYEEWFVTDYDSEFDAYAMLGEYPSFEQLNEVGEMVEDVDMEALSLITDMGYSMEEAIEGLENGDFIIVNDPDIWRYDKDEQIGLAYIYDVLGDDSQCIEMMKNDSNYIDEESYGRDIRLDGSLNYYEEDDPEFYEELENMSDRELGQYFIDELGTEGISESYFDFAYLGRNFRNAGEAYCDGNNVLFMFR